MNTKGAKPTLSVARLHYPSTGRGPTPSSRILSVPVEEMYTFPILSSRLIIAETISRISCYALSTSGCLLASLWQKCSPSFARLLLRRARKDRQWEIGDAWAMTYMTMVYCAVITSRVSPEDISAFGSWLLSSGLY